MAVPQVFPDQSAAAAVAESSDRLQVHVKYSGIKVTNRDGNRQFRSPVGDEFSRVEGQGRIFQCTNFSQK